MKIAVGKEAYSASSLPVKAEGLLFSQNELDSALNDRLPPLLHDDAGKKSVAEYLGGLATTDFVSDRLAEALNSAPPINNWQVGESLAEAYLVDHKGCEFPWPAGRDLRNPNASPAGADLVGFQQHGKTQRFTFGEVKTSKEEQWPPQVVTGKHGLTKQLEDLRDSNRIKDHLVVNYFGHRAPGSTWEASYRQAVKRYLNNAADISLFGVLVRDVVPKTEDLQSRAQMLARGCPSETSIELYALYLPHKSIDSLAKKVKPRKRGAK